MRPDAAALIAGSVGLADGPAGGLRVLAPADMIVHASAHLFADGDLAGGLRNLWDIRCLLEEFGGPTSFGDALSAAAERHGLGSAVARARRLAGHMFGGEKARLRWDDRLAARRLLARDGWGRETRPVTRMGFYVRSHALRMPPAMLARHLWTKARR